MTNDLEPIQRRELSPSLSLSDNGAENSAPPWEEVSAGRYMPRRIRGSYRGRELG